jgi:trehalose utilization protein/predicted GH43/DUF377 family glycosyl hydrolase
MKPTLTLLAALLLAPPATLHAAEPIRVLVWDEQQPQQKQAYGDKFLGETIAEHLAKQPGLSVKTAKLDDPEQGLSDAALDATDVLVIWCHRKVKEQDDKRAEAVVKRVLDGKLSLVALHSAHWAKPFVRLMQERAKTDAIRDVPEADRPTAKWEYVNESPYGKLVKEGDRLTPWVQKLDGNVWRLTLPQCVFPTWRADGKPSHVTTLKPKHPLAAGLPEKWDIPQTEMYGGAFHVPTPDEIVFREDWDKGERFSSGCVWKVGKGRVFYFRPGHETYPIFKQAEPLRVVENAVRWLGTPAEAHELNLVKLRNPVWTAEFNLRDPSVLKTAEGYLVFYSRFSKGEGGWNNPKNWSTACVFTKDFVKFENDRDISVKGFASPGDVVQWHGRWLLPYQSYPEPPVRLCFSESKDLKTWSEPKRFLEKAAELPWNEQRRVIDPTFVVDGDTLHCFFVGSEMHEDRSGKKVRANLMGHALTRDPKLEKWEILTRDKPLIGRSERAPDGVENTMVFKTGDHWTMIYSEGLAKQHLAIATSKNLRDWKLEGPIEIPRQKWFAKKFGAPFVWRDGSQWLMILMGTNDQDRSTFGLLTSPDGKKWTPLPE